MAQESTDAAGSTVTAAISQQGGDPEAIVDHFARDEKLEPPRPIGGWKWGLAGN